MSTTHINIPVNLLKESAETLTRVTSRLSERGRQIEELRSSQQKTAAAVFSVLREHGLTSDKHRDHILNEFAKDPSGATVGVISKLAQQVNALSASLAKEAASKRGTQEIGTVDAREGRPSNKTAMSRAEADMAFDEQIAHIAGR